MDNKQTSKPSSFGIYQHLNGYGGLKVTLITPKVSISLGTCPNFDVTMKIKCKNTGENHPPIIIGYITPDDKLGLLPGITEEQKPIPLLLIKFEKALKESLKQGLPTL